MHACFQIFDGLCNGLRVGVAIKDVGAVGVDEEEAARVSSLIRASWNQERSSMIAYLDFNLRLLSHLGDGAVFAECQRKNFLEFTFRLLTASIA